MDLAEDAFLFPSEGFFSDSMSASGLVVVSFSDLERVLLMVPSTLLVTLFLMLDALRMAYAACIFYFMSIVLVQFYI